MSRSIFALLLYVLFGAATAISAEVPQIIAGKNREIEVIFKNNCVVYFNANGRMTNKLPACSSAQALEAVAAASSYRREQGFDGKVAGHNDPNAGVRVCCQRKSNDWFTTRQMCRGVNGIEVPNQVCRNDTNNRPWSSSRSDYETVCCGRGMHDWFTTRAECRHSGGLEVLRGMCRDDRDNTTWWHGNRGENYDNYDDRPSPAVYAGRADVSLSCYGEGDKPVLENWDDRRWYADRASFPATVVIELNKTGPGETYSGRIHPSGRLLPPLHGGDTAGWWTIKNLVVGPDEIRGRYTLNGLNKPRLRYDRRSGRLSIEGIENFYGRCWSGH
ncbi:MAG: hypothetical protein CTY28_10455 [Hyphomicrobium sp.]|jgi:hypothetical protein|nr:MAG: hypothetical protein CTY28_10455 [Hyphomicrobium sp.]